MKNGNSNVLLEKLTGIHILLKLVVPTKVEHMNPYDRVLVMQVCLVSALFKMLYFKSLVKQILGHLIPS